MSVEKGTEHLYLTDRAPFAWVGGSLGGCCAGSMGKAEGPSAIRWLQAGLGVQRTYPALLLQRPVDLVRLRERMNPALRQAILHEGIKA